MLSPGKIKRQQEQDKQSKAFGTLFGHGKRCSDNNPGVEVVICVRSKFSNSWSVAGFGPAAGRKAVRRAAKAACKAVVDRHEEAIVEIDEEERVAGVQLLEMGVQKGLLARKVVDLLLEELEGGCHEPDQLEACLPGSLPACRARTQTFVLLCCCAAEKDNKKAKAKILTEQLRRKGGPGEPVAMPGPTYQSSITLKSTLHSPLVNAKGVLVST